MFEPFNLDHGYLFDVADERFPYSAHGWHGKRLTIDNFHGTCYGMVTEGRAEVTWFERNAPTPHVHYGLAAGSVFAFPMKAGSSLVILPQLPSFAVGGRGLVICAAFTYGMPMACGPVEATGRLVYIDGCSDTLLLAPLVKGDPCVNHLHIPPGVDQTSHTHPSDRIGVILRGRGECHTPEGDYDLLPGTGWRIPANAVHSFHTRDSSLDVLPWHPDSDCGPTSQQHPMVNRTIVDGQPVRATVSVEKAQQQMADLKARR